MTELKDIKNPQSKLCKLILSLYANEEFLYSEINELYNNPNSS